MHPSYFAGERRVGVNQKLRAKEVGGVDAFFFLFEATWWRHEGIPWRGRLHGTPS